MIFGGPNFQTSASLSANSLDGQNGFVIYGRDAGDRSGKITLCVRVCVHTLHTHVLNALFSRFSPIFRAHTQHESAHVASVRMICSGR